MTCRSNLLAFAVGVLIGVLGLLGLDLLRSHVQWVPSARPAKPDAPSPSPSPAPAPKPPFPSSMFHGVSPDGIA